MAIYYTSDHHFGHENIIRFCNRPFTDVETMNRELVRRHNDVVDKSDTVFHLGDVAFVDNPLKWLKKLNGNIILVKGNHDRGDEGYWTKECKKFITDSTTRLIGEDKQFTITLTHDPASIEYNKNSKGSNEQEGRSPRSPFVVCGHVHERWRFLPNRLNVGVDAWHFQPVPEQQVLSYAQDNQKERQYNMENRGFHNPLVEAKKRRRQLGLDQPNSS